MRCGVTRRTSLSDVGVFEYLPMGAAQFARLNELHPRFTEQDDREDADRQTHAPHNEYATFGADASLRLAFGNLIAACAVGVGSFLTFAAPTTCWP